MYQKIKNSFAYQHTESLEPGLLRLHRTYVVVLDVIVGLNILFALLDGRLLNHPAYIPALISLTLLNLLSFNKSLLKRFGNPLFALNQTLYVILTTLLLWATLATEMPTEMYEWVSFYFRFGFTTIFIPFIITTWQFGLLGTISFLGLSSVLEGAVFLLMLNDMPLYSMLGFIVFRTVNFLIIGGVISRLMLAQRKQRYELTMANQQLTHYATTLEQLSVSRERNRLARELHDTLAHTLSGVSVQLEAVRALWDPKPFEAKAMLNQALSDTRSGLTDTRRALEDLRAEPLEDLGLSLAVEQLCHAFNERTSVKIILEMPEELNLSASAQHCIYRTVQEALANIDRHANAQLVKVSLTHTEAGPLSLMIADDGIGFDPESHPEEGHFGLRGIRERAELIGGSCKIDSMPEEGTTIVLLLNEEEA